MHSISSVIQHSETIFQEALAERTEGIAVKGEIINNLRYADDTVVIAKLKIVAT